MYGSTVLTCPYCNCLKKKENSVRLSFVFSDAGISQMLENAGPGWQLNGQKISWNCNSDSDGFHLPKLWVSDETAAKIA